MCDSGNLMKSNSTLVYALLFFLCFFVLCESKKNFLSVDESTVRHYISAHLESTSKEVFKRIKDKKNCFLTRRIEGKDTCNQSCRDAYFRVDEMCKAKEQSQTLPSMTTDAPTVSPFTVLPTTPIQIANEDTTNTPVSTVPTSISN
ncbi:hypothetical protein AKO1_005753 [Acrasis kona]|uniref:Uncharacterized protein n=1 Tax=Acrasis kona TaxID=1008807 RepID=A0AAW2YK57_9EUKA